MRLAIVLALCLVAGCATKPATSENGPDANVTKTSAPGHAPTSATTSANASSTLPTSTQAPKGTRAKVSLALAEPGLGPTHPLSEPTDTEKGALTLDATARAVLVEAQWSCASPTCGFFLWVLDKDGKILETASGEGTAHIMTTKLAHDATYTLALRSSGPAAQMTGEIRASAFDGAVPEGYSAYAGGKA